MLHRANCLSITYIMKLLICLVLGCAILQAELKALSNNQSHEPDIGQICTEESILERKELESMMGDVTPEDNEAHGKFLVCVMKKRGTMNEDGTLNSEGFKHFLELVVGSERGTQRGAEMIDKILEECEDKHGETPEQTGIKLKNCILQTMKGMESELNEKKV